jgi:hypothetical protein
VLDLTYPNLRSPNSSVSDTHVNTLFLVFVSFVSFVSFALHVRRPKMTAAQPSYPDVDRGAQLAGTYIAGCAISFVFVATRLCARYSIAGVGVDDWCMLVTWV